MSEPGVRSAGRRIAGLDGIRALAVLAVMGVHQQFGWLPGGFYGVDAFFVLSGFLITTLLVSELGGTGSIRLGAFWARRARRLLPALLLMVIVVGLFAAAWPSLLAAPTVPGTASTLFFSANWYFLAQHVNYFAVFAQPSPLLPTWSLAIEEQFYLVWPLVLLAVLTGGRRGDRARPRSAGAYRGRLRGLLALAIAGTAASAALMAWLSPTSASPSRAYYGTDTRAQAILVGAALAIALTLWELPRRRAVRASVTVLAVAGLAGTAALWRWVPETSGLAFHGGFLLAALAAGAVVLQVATAPRGTISRILSIWPLAKLGRISYGVYLWYWPVLLVLSEARTHLEVYALFAVRVAVTVGIATVSFLLLERPVLAGAVTRRRAAVLVPLGLTVALLATALAVAAPPATPPVSSATPLAHGARLKVLLVGDSAAGSLGVGLGQAAPSYGVQLMNEGDPGCSLSMDQRVKTLWYTLAPGAPCRENDPAALLRTWRTMVDHYNPDVVVYVARSDLLNQEVDGRWENIDGGRFDTYLEQRLRQGLAVLGSRGATVVLLTQPYYETEDTPLTPWPEDQPSRVVRYNRIIRQVAAAYGPKRVDVFDLGALLSPGGAFTASVQGTTVRCSDGVHFTAAGGALVARRLFPRLLALGKTHHRDSPGGRWPGTPPPTTPAWWYQLPCQD